MMNLPFHQQLRRIELSFKNLVKQAAAFIQSTLMVQVLSTSWKARLLSTVAGLITRMGLVTFGYFCWDWTGYTV